MFLTSQDKFNQGKKDILNATRTVLSSYRQGPPLKQISRDTELPLSFIQQRLWFLHQLEPNNPTYNKYITLRISGALNIVVMKQSISEIVKRHEILRTIFPTITGQPVQIIKPTFSLMWQVTDIRELPKQERENKALQLAIEESQRPFVLDKEILIRTNLLQLDEKDFVLIITTHQIAFDDQSIEIFYRELTVIYKALSSGEKSLLPNLLIQYADFAYWQRHWLRENVLETQMSYWQKQFGSGLSSLHFPTDYPQTTDSNSQSASQFFELSSNISKGLMRLSHQEGVTLFVILLATLQILLCHYTTQKNILVFSSTNGRNHPRLKKLIGTFSDLLILYTDISGNPSFQELLHRVHEVVLGAYTHQGIPLENLLEFLQSKRKQNHTPIFQIMFVLIKASIPILELPNLTITPFKISKEITKFNLNLLMRETERGLIGQLTYKTSLFNTDTIVQILKHFQTLLEAIITDPNQRISELLCLTKGEQQLPIFGHHNLFVSDSNIADLGKNYQAPRNALELELTKIWQKIFKTSDIGINDNFFDLGGHSLLAVTLLNKIEKKFSKTLSLSTLFQATTIKKLANILRHSKCSASTSPLVLLQPHGSKPPFFYITPAGVTASNCNNLVRHLIPDRPFYALQEIGLGEGKLIPHTSIEEIATYYIQQIRIVQPHGPYFLGGACFGNVVAFEIAQQLYKQREEIALLAMFDGFWPDHVAERPQSKLIYLIKYITRHLTILSLLSLQEKWNYIFQLIQRIFLKVFYKISTSKIHESSFIFQAFYYQDLGRQLRINYVPQVYPGHVSIIKANIKHDWLSPDPDEDKEKFLSVWSRFTTKGAKIYDFSSHHYLMFKEPYVQDLANKLQTCLDEAQTNISKSGSVYKQ